MKIRFTKPDGVRKPGDIHDVPEKKVKVRNVQPKKA